VAFFFDYFNKRSKVTLMEPLLNEREAALVTTLTNEPEADREKSIPPVTAPATASAPSTWTPSSRKTEAKWRKLVTAHKDRIEELVGAELKRSELKQGMCLYEPVRDELISQATKIAYGCARTYDTRKGTFENYVSSSIRRAWVPVEDINRKDALNRLGKGIWSDDGDLVYYDRFRGKKTRTNTSARIAKQDVSSKPGPGKEEDAIIRGQWHRVGKPVVQFPSAANWGAPALHHRFMSHPSGTGTGEIKFVGIDPEPEPAHRLPATLAEAIDALPERYQRPVLHMRFAGKTWKHVARRTNRSEDQLKRRLSSLEEALRANYCHGIHEIRGGQDFSA
jgi:hypothetical protein